MFRATDKLKWKRESDSLVGELSRNNIPYDVRQRLEHRKSMIRRVLSHSDIMELYVFLLNF